MFFNNDLSCCVRSRLAPWHTPPDSVRSPCLSSFRLAKGRVCRPTPTKPRQTSAVKAAALAARASSASELGQEMLVDSDGRPTPTNVRRRLERRDTDAAVDRVIETRLLKKFDLSVIEGARNSKGESIRQALRGAA